MVVNPGITQFWDYFRVFCLRLSLDSRRACFSLHFEAAKNFARLAVRARLGGGQGVLAARHFAPACYAID